MPTTYFSRNEKLLENSSDTNGNPQVGKKIDSQNCRGTNVITGEKSILGIVVREEEGGSRGLKHGAYCCGGRN